MVPTEGTAAAHERTPRIITNQAGVVEVGVWSTLPPGYTPITDRALANKALMEFNAGELREKILFLCGY